MYISECSARPAAYAKLLRADPDPQKAETEPHNPFPILHTRNRNRRITNPEICSLSLSLTPIAHSH